MRPRIAYLMSRFPKATETFIVREATEVEAQGFDIRFFAFTHQQDTVIQPEAERYLERVTFGERRFRRLLGDNLFWLRTRPGAYAGCFLTALVANLRSPKFLLRTIVAVPVAAGFARRIADGGYGWVHAHYASHPTTAAHTISALTDLPYSFTAHAHDIYVDRSMLGTKCERAAFIATVSSFNKRLLGRLYGAEIEAKTAVVRCGVDPALFSSADGRSEERLAPVNGPLRIVSTGSLEPYKGHRYLIDACAKVAVEGLDVHCTIIGEGELRAELTAAITDLGMHDRIELVGHRSRQDVLAMLRAADIFALASVETASGKMEGVPVALMEAMSVGLPVIGSDLSGIPELIQHGVTGMLTAPGDADAIASTIRLLAADPSLRASLGDKARETVMTEYDQSANAAVLAGLFRTGIAAGGTPPVADLQSDESDPT